jgi:predicted RecA/RadA family phage recombinase
MTTRYLKPGEALDHTNHSGAAINVNDVIVAGALVAVAATNIAIGATATMLANGVFTLPKKAGTAMPEGTRVTWSVADKAFIVGTGVAGDVANAGIVVEADAAAVDTSARVLIAPGLGTVVAA